MKSPFLEFGGGNLYMHPFEAQNFDNYIFPKKYPLCCPFHINLIESNKQWFEKFPDCCEHHKRLIGSWWFDKNKFVNLPEKIVRQISLTVNHIEININKEDWYEDFTNYFEYNLQSFGSPSVGEDRYISGLKHFFLNHKDAASIPEDKRNKVLDFIKGLYEKPVNEDSHEPTNFNRLYEVYQKWFENFPFDLSYFKNVKEHFARTLPFVNGEIRHNPYTGMAVAKLQTPENLVLTLTQLTRDILSRIESIKLLGENKIPDTLSHQISIINESHRIKQSRLLMDFTEGEKGYMFVIDKWLENEGGYFRDMVPLLKEQSAIESKELHNCSKELQSIAAAENKFRKWIPMTFVVNHFMVLTKRKNKNEIPFLSEQQLIVFLKRAFLNDKKKGKVKANLSTSEKGLFVSLFYNFYDACVSIYGDDNKRQDYISLIADHFSNHWTRDSIESLFRKDATKRKW